MTEVWSGLSNHLILLFLPLLTYIKLYYTTIHTIPYLNQIRPKQTQQTKQTKQTTIPINTHCTTAINYYIHQQKPNLPMAQHNDLYHNIIQNGISSTCKTFTFWDKHFWLEHIHRAVEIIRNNINDTISFWPWQQTKPLVIFMKALTNWHSWFYSFPIGITIKIWNTTSLWHPSWKDWTCHTSSNHCSKKQTESLILFSILLTWDSGGNSTQTIQILYFLIQEASLPLIHRSLVCHGYLIS
jgi:hypothetical protein